MFNKAIREAFPTEQEFEGIARRWGVVQAAQVLVELQGLGRRDENRAFTEALTEQYERFYGSAEKHGNGEALEEILEIEDSLSRDCSRNCRVFEGRVHFPAACGIATIT